VAPTGDDGAFCSKAQAGALKGDLDVGTLLNAGIDDITSLDDISVSVGVVDTLCKLQRSACR
jgi:hypothetical protein